MRTSVEDVDKGAAQRVQHAIYTALSQNSDTAFSELLNAVSQPPSDVLIDIRHSETGATALMVASARGRVDIVRALLALGADYKLTAHQGKTALDWALWCGQEDVVKLLEQHAESERALVVTADAAEALASYQASIDQDRIDMDLIERLLMYLYCEGIYGESSVRLFK
jgi:ankyrin repeat protein